MKKQFCTILMGILVLCACSLPITPHPPIPTATTQAPTAVPATVGPSEPGQCGYQWANQDLRELAASFQQSIQALQAGAKAGAYAFGENCVRADGTVAGFSAMETDFNILLQVGDLTNEEELGGWIVNVMQVIEAIPADQITGPRPGRVTITFQGPGDQKTINFYRDRYDGLAPGLSHSEIYQALQTPR